MADKAGRSVLELRFFQKEVFEDFVTESVGQEGMNCGLLEIFNPGIVAHKTALYASL